MLNITITARDSEGFSWEIPVNEQFEGVTITSISQYVAFDPNEVSGDIAVNWNTDGLTDNPAAATMGTLQLRDLHSSDEVTGVMGKFYWENGWDSRLRQLLLTAGFTAAAAEAVTGSEWGMQEPGRASYDAYECADEARAYAMQTA